MDKFELNLGDAVTLHKDDGSLDGHVTAWERDGAVAVVTPDEPVMQRWYPKGYQIGKAHWGTTLRRKQPSDAV